MSRKNLGSIHSAVDGAVADSLQAEESSRTSALSFNDSKVAFESKTTFEIIRALVVYRLCSVKLLTRNAGKLLSASNAILGKTITEAAIKYTFFYHFCAGENSEDIKPVIQRLSSNGINSILDFAAERDKDPEEQTISGAECRTYNEDIADQECEENLEIFMECIRAASQFENGFAAIKLTGLGRPELLETVSDVVQSVRMAFINLQKSNPNELTWSEFLSGIRSLNVNIEDSEAKDLFHRFDQDKDGKIDFLEWTEYLRVEDSLTRPFFYQPNDSSSKSILPCLDQEKLAELDRVIARIDRLASFAAENKVRLMVDAEQTYFQPGIDHIVLNLQRKYNRSFPVIFSTYQAYLKDSLSRLETDIRRARKEGFKFAAKLVRGAYMVAERKRANELGITDPVQPDLKHTHTNYHSCLDLMFENIDVCEIMIASHNQASIEYATEQMQKRGIQSKSDGVYFGQLLGMADHLSSVLGKNGYAAYKYVPFGLVQQVVPYLIRRAEENSSVLDGEGVAKERQMLWDELMRRFIPWRF